MTFTTPMGVRWPDEREKPFWASIELTKADVDKIRENSEFVFRNSQVLKWDGADLSWGKSFYIHSPRVDKRLRIVGPDTLTLPVSNFLYVVPSVQPIIDEDATLAAGATVPTGAIVLGMNDAGVFYSSMKRSVGADVFDSRGTPVDVGEILAGASAKSNLGCDNHLRGVCHALEVKRTVGSADDVAIQLYDEDPDGAGVLIYEVPSTNIPPLDAIWASTGEYIDRNLWYFELQNDGSLWVKLTNNSLVASEFSVGIRFREED